MRWWQRGWWWGENDCGITELCDANTEYWRVFPQDSVFTVLPSYQYSSDMEGGEVGNRRSTDTYRRSQLGSQLLARSPYNKTRFTIFTIILWLGKANKSQFLHCRPIQFWSHGCSFRRLRSLIWSSYVRPPWSNEGSLWVCRDFTMSPKGSVVVCLIYPFFLLTYRETCQCSKHLWHDICTPNIFLLHIKLIFLDDFIINVCACLT